MSSLVLFTFIRGIWIQCEICNVHTETLKLCLDIKVEDIICDGIIEFQRYILIGFEIESLDI